MTLGEEIQCRRLLLAFLLKRETGIDILHLAKQHRRQRLLQPKSMSKTDIQNSCGVKSDHGLSDEYHLHFDVEDNLHDPNKFYGSWEDL